MKKILRRILGFAASIYFGTHATKFLFATGQLQSDTSSGQKFITESAWRQTKFGWQDANRWFLDSFSPQQSFEVIHPLIWATLVLTAVIGVMIWASEEWDVDRLFEDDGTDSGPTEPRTTQ